VTRRTKYLVTFASDSLIRRRLVPRADLTATDTKLWAANGTEVGMLGTMCLRYNVGSQTLVTKFLVTDHVDELILGYDWLAVNKCQCNFKKKVLLVNGQSVALRTRHSRPTVHRIYVPEQITDFAKHAGKYTSKYAVRQSSDNQRDVRMSDVREMSSKDVRLS